LKCVPKFFISILRESHLPFLFPRTAQAATGRTRASTRLTPTQFASGLMWSWLRLSPWCLVVMILGFCIFGR
jgi:hypothetical protein